MFEWVNNENTMRSITVWTARSVLPSFITAFLCAGWQSRIQRIACRIAAFAMALHLIALLLLNHLIGKAPLAFHTPMEALISVGGAVALVLVLVGWSFGDKPWYRWAMYWPWAVFIFTYVFLPRYGDAAPRILAAPVYFGPILAFLFGAFLWRVRLDFKTAQAQPRAGADAANNGPRRSA